ncbi:MAG: hypothetical protein IH963_09895, partial [Chloroflexi bacterium]|nr:hypothetical protein [Chloroflexota bacterium]
LLSYDGAESGVIRFESSATGGFAGEGSVAVVKFRIVGSMGSSSGLTLSSSSATDASSGPLSVDLVNGDLSVREQLIGDGNGDRRITALDALIALKLAAQQPGLENSSMDVDGDGRVTLEDARQILRMASPGLED